MVTASRSTTVIKLISLTRKTDLNQSRRSRSVDESRSREDKQTVKLVPIGQCVFDVVACRVDEDSVFVPRSAFHADIFVHRAQALELTRADSDRCKQRHPICNRNMQK